MSPDPNNLQDLLEIAVDLAREAGDITLKYFQAGIDTMTKDDGTPVTQADRETEAFLRQALGKRFPQDGIHGEEYGREVGESGRTWVIDPIDGTRSFIYGVPLYGLLMALLEENEPILGILYLPALGDLLAARRGGGAWCNGKQVRVSTENDLSRALLLTSEMPAPETETARCLEPLLGRVGLRRTWGDCFGYAQVARGLGEVMIDPEASPWDLAAIAPILTEAGGRFSDLEGRETIWSGHGFATNGILHEPILRLLEERRGS